MIWAMMRWVRNILSWPILRSMTYDIFISYKRRGTSSATAAYLYELLIKKGYNVFFDRKEMRSGKFDEQLLEHITNAQDIIILLEETSLASCFSEIEDYYQTDWFCREVMHALSFKDKNIIPLLLNGYNMPEADVLPPEMKELPRCQALPLDITEVEELYQKYFVDREYLRSKPKNLAISRSYQNKGAVVGQFLFHTKAKSCDLYERGELIFTLTNDNDLSHPFCYPVTFAGEHYFELFNNDTCEEQCIVKRVAPSCQEYINVEWQETKCLWEITEKEIAEQMDSEILAHWGQCLLDGNSLHEPDFSKAYQCLCKAESIDATKTDTIFANAYHKVLDANASYDMQFPWIVKAVEQNDPFAIFYLGKLYYFGRGVEKDIDKAIKYYTMAADMDNAKALNNLGSIYDAGKYVPRDRQKAYELYKRGAELGSTFAMWNLGIYYRDGKVVEKNRAKAYELFQKAADGKNARAMYDLGRLYYEDNDHDTALSWYETAAEVSMKNDTHGVAGMAYRRIGDYYDEVKHDYPTALEYLQKSYDIGNTFAISKLGIMYEEGRGVVADPEKAVAFYHEALEKKPKHCRALYRLASCYERGCGVIQNIDKACEFYKKLVELNDEYIKEATEALTRLEIK